MAVRTPASPDWFNVTVRGTAEVGAKLDALTMAIKKKLVGKALQTTGEPIKDAMQMTLAARVRSGTLRDSVGIKLVVKDGVGYLVIGPQRNIQVPLRMVKRGSHKDTILVAIPTRYAHLVEFGHKVVVHGQVVGFVAPLPFARNAWAIAGGDKAVDNFARALEGLIAAEPL